MRLAVLAVGQRMPAWADEAYADYAKRFPPTLKLELREIKAEPRSGGKTAAQCMAAERSRIEAAMPSGAYRVALDERGKTLTTLALADRLRHWLTLGQDLAFLIGGPDGLEPALREAADERIRLSDLTLPHAMARVVLAEALYRAHTVVIGHPYHRE